MKKLKLDEFTKINDHLCDYGCNKISKYFFPTVKKYCCSKHWTRCEIMRQKKSKLLKGRVSPTLGKKYSEESKRKIGNTKIGKPRDENTRKKLSEFRKGKTYEDLYGIEKAKIQREIKRQWMLNGKSSYVNSFNKSPSKPQVEIFKIVKNLFPSAILNYPCLNYSIDIAIPDLKIAIESDGSWYHQNLENDLIRQKNIENEGWKFIKYTIYDKFPSIEQLKEDIIKIMKE